MWTPTLIQWVALISPRCRNARLVIARGSGQNSRLINVSAVVALGVSMIGPRPIVGEPMHPVP